MSTVMQIVKARHALPAPAVRRQLRRAAGLSQEDIARELGVTHQAISLWEAGARTPSRRHVTGYFALLDELRATLARTQEEVIPEPRRVA